MKTIPTHVHHPYDSELLRLLYQQVNERLKTLSPARITVLRIKVWILPAMYCGLYILALMNASTPWLYYLMLTMMGIMVVIIFTNLIHELCHGNVYKKEKYNKWGYYLFDFLGANSYIWQQRHLVLHHRFPNVNGWDADVEQKGPIAIFPSEPVQRMHRFQHIYIFLLYPLFLINWLFVRDFRDFFSKNRTIRKAVEIPFIEYLKLLLFKAGYLLMILVLPPLVTGIPWLQSLLGMLILSVSGSLLAMVVLLTPHINSGNNFPEADETGKIPYSWLRHQFLVTNDIDNTNWFIRNVMGNFNFHMAHHIFPRISSVYGPEITAVVKAFATEHDLPYRSYPLSESFRKHSQLIRYNARRAASLV